MFWKSWVTTLIFDVLYAVLLVDLLAFKGSNILHNHPAHPWSCLNIKTVPPGVGISIIKIRWSWDHLLFITGIHILLRQHLYIKTVTPALINILILKCSGMLWLLIHAADNSLLHTYMYHYFDGLMQRRCNPFAWAMESRVLCIYNIDFMSQHGNGWTWNYLSIPKLQRLHRWSLGI